jgi:hypothetical protein
VPPPGRVQVDAGQERGEIGGGHLAATSRGVRDAEKTGGGTQSEHSSSSTTAMSWRRV